MNRIGSIRHRLIIQALKLSSSLHNGRGWGWVFLLLLSSCAIKDDIPYPIVEGAIIGFEVEGQCDTEGNETNFASMDYDARIVRLYVNDLVDVSDLRIKHIEVTNDALIIKDSVVYGKSDKYFTKGYSQTGSLGNLRADFTRDAKFILRTWQDYEWTV